MNEPKYLLDGSAVEVLETLGNGKLLVARLYETYGEEDEVSVDLSAPFVVDRVFDSAPTQVMDSRIEEAQQCLDALEAQRVEVVNKLRAAQAGEREIEGKLKRHAQLSRLMDFIDGKITHYVEVCSWSPPRLLEFKDAMASDEDRWNKKMKLLVLYGASNGDLEWNISQYSDGSGGRRHVLPCCSLEEAMVKMTEAFAVRFSEPPRRDILDAADKSGIPVPAEYRESVAGMERQDLEKHAKTLRAQLEVIDAKLVALA